MEDLSFTLHTQFEIFTYEVYFSLTISMGLQLNHLRRVHYGTITV